MITQIIKKDGSKIPFSKSKIDRAISRAANDAKLSTEETNKLVTQVGDAAMRFLESKDKATTSELRDKILSELDRVAPKVSAEWRKFMNKQA